MVGANLPALRQSVLAVCLLAGLLPAAFADGNCTITLSGSAGNVLCVGGVPPQVGNVSLGKALEPLASAMSVTVELRDVPLTPITFSRSLDMVLGVGASPNTSTVTAVLTNCSMGGREVDYASLVGWVGAKTVELRLQNSEFIGNKLNITGALAAQDALSISLQILSSTIRRNQLIALGAAAVGTSGQAAITVAQGSAVVANDVRLLGALAVGGSAAFSAQLAVSNVTSNNLTQMGLIATGGSVAASVNGLEDPSVNVAGNNVSGGVEVFSEQPLVPAALDVIMGLAFNETGFDLGSALARVQSELCTVLAKGGNLSDAGLPADLQAALQSIADQVNSLLCVNGAPNPAVNLTDFASQLEGLGGQGLSGLAPLLDELLGNSTLVQSVIAAIEGKAPLGSALDDLLAALLSNPGVQAGVSVLGDLLNQLAQLLGTPIGGGAVGPDKPPATSGGTTANPGGGDLGAVLQSIIESVGGGAGVGAGVGGIAEQLGSIVQQILGGISGSGGNSSVTPSDIINSIIGALTGGQGSPLAGQDVSSVIPVLGAILSDPQAVASLPGLLGGLLGGGQGGQGGMPNLAPILSAISGDPQASAALPSVLGLLGQLGIGLPGN